MLSSEEKATTQGASLSLSSQPTNILDCLHSLLPPLCPLFFLLSPPFPTFTVLFSSLEGGKLAWFATGRLASSELGCFVRIHIFPSPFAVGLHQDHLIFSFATTVMEIPTRKTQAGTWRKGETQGRTQRCFVKVQLSPTVSHSFDRLGNSGTLSAYSHAHQNDCLLLNHS